MYVLKEQIASVLVIYPLLVASRYILILKGNQLFKIIGPEGVEVVHTVIASADRYNLVDGTFYRA
jgi:hypothetical protein